MRAKHYFPKSTILLLFVFCSLFSLQAANIEKGPYLMYMGNNTQMKVMWQLDAAATCTLEWGTTTSYSSGSVQTSAYGNDNQHTHVITNLTNSTKYYYRVSFGSTSLTGSFRSAPANSAQNLKFFAYGDTRSNPSDQDSVTNRMISTFTNDPLYQTFCIHSADWTQSNSESDWTNEFFPRNYTNTINFQAQVPIQGCKGNHEGSGSVLDKYYPYPYVNAFYWSYDYGPVHVAVVDQYVNYGSGSTQYNWLANDLANTSKQWKVVVFHEPAWSAGTHGNDSTAQNDLQPLCVQHGVSLVFNGHNHYYSRCLVEDVHHITTGGGGAPLYGTDSGFPYLVATSQSNHHCEIDIQGNTLNFTARRSSGAVIDSFQINNGPSVPAAAFTAGTTNASTGQSITFTDQSTNVPTSWSWDFGDGGSSTQQNPSHSYSSAGTYTVELTVSNSAGSDTATKTNYITVTSPQPPVAAFSATPTNAYTGQSVSFTDSSANNPTSWSWNFGDGGSSTQQNPGHTYNSVGTYTVSLTVTNAVGGDTDTKTDYISVTDAPITYCDFSAGSQQYESILTVVVADLNNSSQASPYTNFTHLTANLTAGETASVSLTPDFHSGGPYTEHWKIWIDWNQDGDFTDSGEEVFSGSGTADVTGSIDVPASADGVTTRMRVAMQYNAALTTSCDSFAEGEVEDYTVQVTGAVVNPPVAAFTASATDISTGESVSFSDQSTNTPTSWSWNFGDGGTSTQQNPSHTYSTAGNYTVTLTATNSAGSDGETKANYITVTAPPPPVAAFTANATVIDKGQSVTFTDQTTNAPTSWSWNFGDGGSSTQQNPSHTYNTPGTYTVSLTATNAVGSDTETKADYITVKDVQVTYCTFEGSSQAYEYIAGVQVGNVNNNSGAAKYEDFTSFIVNTSVGQNVSVSLTPGFVGNPYSEFWTIWIDWNGDGDFDDAGEEVFTGTGNSDVTGSFTVPSSASGTVRMRIAMQYNAYVTTSCGSFAEGEVEDYTVNIQ